VPHSSLAVVCETRVGILTLILNTSAPSALKLLAFARILYASCCIPVAPKPKSSSTVLDPASTNGSNPECERVPPMEIPQKDRFFPSSECSRELGVQPIE
jgi:hypothetical protein